MNDLYGLLGEPLSHSLSPQIHSYIFGQLGLDAKYFLFPLKSGDLAAAVTGLKLLGATGVNITIPYKVTIMSMLDQISPEAKAIGAVNTILFKDQHTTGYNTDYHGFGLLLKNESISVNGKTAILLGTGGAAKMAACYLKDHGIGDLHLVTRTPLDARSTLPLLSYGELALAPGADMIINCTPVGMFPHVEESPIHQQFLKKYSIAIDLIYNPFETRFLREAREFGLKTCNGLMMLVGQAVVAEELWQDQKINMAILQPLYSILSAHLQQ